MEAAVKYIESIGREACRAVDYAGFIVSRDIKRSSKMSFQISNGRKQT